MRNRNNKIDVPNAISTYFLFSYLYPTTITNDPFVTYSFVLTTSTLIILNRTKNTLAKQTITFRFVCTIIYSFRLQHLTTRFSQNRFRRRKTNRDLIKSRYCCILIIISCHNTLCRKLIVLTSLIPYKATFPKKRSLICIYSSRRMSSPSPLSSCINTLNDSGKPGSGIGSPFTMLSYVLALPITSSDFTVSISLRVAEAP